ncbi:hypothetical protein M413DRAFT_424108 [Hebeloma cylindrosporum]|uniref:Uncharacterized protein n=1 Tax=Hebeloma cylindrosporum TaxID=76867 RepID=A0A0C3BY28_HEBCY|nr:hypothetical protein M413DRAFT_424108 [Hebeloma cylindrosporum h7]
MLIQQLKDTRPLEQYFAEYPTFAYDSNEPPTSEFYRMCDQFGWVRDDDDRDDAFQSFRVALTKEFNEIYGLDVNNLAAWQLLCVRLGVDPVPAKIKECRAIVTTTHVNLVDLVSNSGTVTVFDTVDDLSEYSRATGKIFPREDAYAGDLLKYLLRHIFEPSIDAHLVSRHRGQRRRGRGGRGAGGGTEGGRSRGRGRGGGRGKTGGRGKGRRG